MNYVKLLLLSYPEDLKKFEYLILENKPLKHKIIANTQTNN